MSDSLSLILQLHTPDEIIYFSNIAHWIEGGLFIVIGIFALIQTFGGRKGRMAGYIWPSVILAAGLFLPIFSFVHHFDEMALAWKATITIPQQRQHMLMAIIITIAGIAELIYLRSRSKVNLLRLVLPAGLGLIGLLFITHPQHGTDEAVMRATMIHQYLGTALILAGVFRVFEVVLTKQPSWLKYTWIGFLIIAAIFLITYREPPGAYDFEQLNMNSHVQ